ncbi:MAG TPA: H-NS histone family protein [Aquabacterium sp.]|nr:H-NS histone family protein [Aquabacterium sp.]
MTTLTAINKKIEELKKQADAIVKAEKREAIAKVRDLITKFGLVAEDVGLGKAGKRSRVAAAKKTGAATANAAKYRDPATGKTWTGVGRAPAWIANAKDRSKLLIDGGSVAVAATESAPAKAASKKKATAVKPADKATKGSKASAPAKPVAAKKAKRVAAKKSAPVPEAGTSASEQVGQAARA